ncbi:MAG: hypothetical protein ACFB16_02555 [Phormidesmis sp.]
MLAYTTISDLFYVPTALEVVVYIGGLIFLMASPYLFLSLMDLRRNAAAKRKTQTDTQAQP